MNSCATCLKLGCNFLYTPYCFTCLCLFPCYSLNGTLVHLLFNSSNFHNDYSDTMISPGQSQVLALLYSQSTSSITAFILLHNCLHSQIHVNIIQIYAVYKTHFRIKDRRVKRMEKDTLPEKQQLRDSQSSYSNTKTQQTLR